MLDPFTQGFLVYSGVVISVMIWTFWKEFHGDKIQPIPKSESSRIKLGILGMPGSGKTSLLNFLDNNNRTIGGQSFDQPYEAFEYSFHDEDRSNVKVASGIDIPGAKESRQQHMMPFLNEKDVVIYIFDIFEYLSDREYEKDTNGDLEFIYSHCRYKSGSLKVCILLSHIDKYGSTRKKAKKLDEFKKKVRGLSYARVIFDNYAPVNIMDKEQLIEIEKKLFP